jgi:hypothetical protein
VLTHTRITFVELSTITAAGIELGHFPAFAGFGADLGNDPVNGK